LIPENVTKVVLQDQKPIAIVYDKYYQVSNTTTGVIPGYPGQIFGN